MFAKVNGKLIKRVNPARFLGGLNDELNETRIQGTAEAEKWWSDLLTCKTHIAEQFILMLMVCGLKVADHLL